MTIWAHNQYVPDGTISAHISTRSDDFGPYSVPDVTSSAHKVYTPDVTISAHEVYTPDVTISAIISVPDVTSLAQSKYRMGRFRRVISLCTGWDDFGLYSVLDVTISVYNRYRYVNTRRFAPPVAYAARYACSGSKNIVKRIKNSPCLIVSANWRLENAKSPAAMPQENNPQTPHA